VNSEGRELQERGKEASIREGRLRTFLAVRLGPKSARGESDSEKKVLKGGMCWRKREGKSRKRKEKSFLAERGTGAPEEESTRGPVLGREKRSPKERAAAGGKKVQEIISNNRKRGGSRPSPAKRKKNGKETPPKHPQGTDVQKNPPKVFLKKHPPPKPVENKVNKILPQKPGKSQEKDTRQSFRCEWNKSSSLGKRTE